MKRNILFLFLYSIIFYSCTKNNSVIPPPPPTGSSGYYVINEGVFGQNNSSISFFNPESGELISNAYSAANNTTLGDNANSIFVFKNKGYIAVNGSNKIEVINLETFVSEGFVDLGSGASPREIYIQDEVVGYVTSLLGEVVKFNPTTKVVINRTIVGSYPEGIVQAAGKLFIANSWFGDINNISRSVSVIDTSIGIEGAKIFVGVNPTKILKGEDGNIYVICTGSYTDTTLFSGVYRINPQTNSVIDSIEVKNNPIEAVFLSNTQLLVVNSEGAFEINIPNKRVGNTPLISTNEVTTSQFGIIYSLAYDEVRQNILCGNPKDFLQNGEIVIFDRSGNKTGSFESGINPGTIVVIN